MTKAALTSATATVSWGQAEGSLQHLGPGHHSYPDRRYRPATKPRIRFEHRKPIRPRDRPSSAWSRSYADRRTPAAFNTDGGTPTSRQAAYLMPFSSL